MVNGRIYIALFQVYRVLTTHSHSHTQGGAGGHWEQVAIHSHTTPHQTLQEQFRVNSPRTRRVQRSGIEPSTFQSVVTPLNLMIYTANTLVGRNLTFQSFIHYFFTIFFKGFWLTITIAYYLKQSTVF